MSGLYDSASAVMRVAERQIDVVAQNVANIQTAGYKRQVSFTDLLTTQVADTDQADLISTQRLMAQGKMVETGKPDDLAISGPGMFALRRGDAVIYSREGQFHRDEDGRLVNAQGYALQQAEGGDLVVGRGAMAVAEDGTVTSDGQPVAKIGLFAADNMAALTASNGTHFVAPEGMMNPIEGTVRQGMYEASNVSLGDEMTAMTMAMRHAETGAKLMQMYDDLVGQAITTLGRTGQ